MDAKELIQKLKVLLGMETEKAPEAPTEPTNEQTELAAAEAPIEAPAEPVEPAAETTPVEAPTESTEAALEAEQPAEPATPAEPEANPLEKRINDLESKIDELYGVIQALVEKQAVEAKEVPPTTTAVPAQFAAQEEQKPMSRTDRVLALKNMMKE